MAVTNPYYEFAPEFLPGTKARSEEVNLQYQAIQNAFDLLPGGAADALTTGTATFAPESGTGNAYVVTMPDTRTNEQDGDEVIFFATHTNTGASTLEVDGLGAKSIVRADGTAVVSGDLVNGLLYVLRYDATNTRYQLVGPSTSYLSQAQTAATNASASAAAALVSQNLAQEWAANPIDDDISTNPGEYSSLHWANASEAWAINAEDVAIGTTFGGDGATTYSAYHWAQKALGAASIQRIIANISTATPPTTEAVTARLDYYDADETDQLAFVGFNGNNTFQIENRMHGGTLNLDGENGAGTAVNFLTADPAAGVKLYYAGTQVLETTLSGIEVRDSDGINPIFAIRGNTGFDLAWIQHNTNLLIDQLSNGDNIYLRSYDLGGTQRNLIVGDPDDNVSLYYAGALVTRTAAAASGGLEANNTLTGAGFERVLTASDLFSATTTLDIIGDINTATPPTTEAITALLQYVDNDQTDVIGSVGYTAGNDLELRNYMHFGLVDIYYDHITNGQTLALRADPNLDNIALYQGGNIKLRTSGDGPDFYGSSSANFINYYNDAGVQLGYSQITYGTAPEDWTFKTYGHGEGFRFIGEDSIGVAVTFLEMDWVSVRLYDNNVEVARTVTAGAGGLQANNTATGAGFERVLTTSDLGGGVPASTVVDSILVGDGASGWAEDTTLRFESSGTDMFLWTATLGGDIYLSSGDPNGTGEAMLSCLGNGAVIAYHNNNIRMATETVGIRVNGSLGNDPTVGGVQSARLLFANSSSVGIGEIDWNSTADMSISNAVHGGEVIITAEDSLGTEYTLLSANPEIGTGGVSLYTAGVATVQSRPDGIRIAPTGAAANFYFYNTGFATQLGYLSHNATNLTIQNVVNSGSVIIQGETTGDVVRTLIAGDPDGSVDAYYAGNLKLNTNVDGISVRGSLNNVAGGLQDAEIRLENSSGIPIANIHYDGTADLYIDTINTGGDVIIRAKDAGATLRTILSGNPDGATTLRGDSNVNVEVNAGASTLAVFSTAGLTMEAASGNTELVLQKAAIASQAKFRLYQEGGTEKWSFGLTSTTADDLFVARYNDSGTFQENAVYIDSATGLITLRGDIEHAGTNPVITLLDRGEIHFRDDVGTSEGMHVYNDSITTAAQTVKISSNAATPLVELMDAIQLRFYGASNVQYGAFQTNDISLFVNCVLSAGLTDGWHWNNEIMDQMILREYSVESQSEVVVTNAVTLTYGEGNAFEVDLEAATGTVTITLSGGPPTGTYGEMVVKVQQDGTAARTITWAGGTFRWEGGSAHVMNSTLDGFSIYRFESWDGGTTWHGRGADYS